MYLVHTMSTFSLFLKEILLIFLFFFNNFLIANKFEISSAQDAGFSKDRLNKIGTSIFFNGSVKKKR